MDVLRIIHPLRVASNERTMDRRYKQPRLYSSRILFISTGLTIIGDIKGERERFTNMAAIFNEVPGGSGMT